MDADINDTRNPTTNEDDLPAEMHRLRRLLKADLDAVADRILDQTAQQFETHATQLDDLEHQVAELQATAHRIDNRVTATVEQVQDHQAQIRRLNEAAA